MWVPLALYIVRKQLTAVQIILCKAMCLQRLANMDGNHIKNKFKKYVFANVLWERKYTQHIYKLNNLFEFPEGARHDEHKHRLNALVFRLLVA